jgi:hypothetical protein
LKRFILLLLIPIGLKAQVTQPVAPILSNDYQLLIRNKKTNLTSVVKDSSYSIAMSTATLANYRDLNKDLKNVSIVGNKLKIKEGFYKRIELGITYSTAIGMKKANNQPALQKNYVQGASLNGKLTWRGADDNEAFSYGPNINNLFYDGSNYTYDSNGRLTSSNDGSPAAKPYNNSILRNGLLFSQSLNTQVKLFKTYTNYWDFNILANQSTENLIISFNKNTSRNLTFATTRRKNKFQYSSTYFYMNNQFSNSNRNGLLNRAYQNSLLTPISFNNKENTPLPNGQRSFYNGADNPNFLLQNNDNPYNQSQHIISATASKKESDFNFDITPTFQWTNENTNEHYKPSTASFTNGISNKRNKTTKNFTLITNTKYKIKNDFSDARPEIGLVQNITKATTAIEYTNNNSKTYNYKRTTYEANINFTINQNDYPNEYGINASNKIYLSNTTNQQQLWLPSLNFYYRRNDLFDNNLKLKAVGNFNKYANELSLSQSLSGNTLLQLSTAEANQFLPLLEVSSYNNIHPIVHQDYNAVIELDYKNKLRFSTEFFVKRTKNDGFAIFENNQLQLKNIASHKTTGVEIELAYNKNIYNNTEKVGQWHTLSFVKYNTKVTQVANGYNYTPIAGFSNIHKALINGEAFGVIVGNSYLRDKANNIVIGTDGFPLVDNTPKKIGNPNPNFIVKLNNALKYKRFNLTIDWEWKNGGDIWNGTQAVLDYYGRSKETGQLRNTTNYIYTGVTTTGQTNTTPVNFYDKRFPVTQNNWTRYGYTGVAEAYIQKADQVKLNTLSLSYTKLCKKHIQQFAVGAHCNNIILWSAYKGVDSNQLLYDQSNTTGLDFFNLPSTQYWGLTLTVKY